MKNILAATSDVWQVWLIFAIYMAGMLVVAFLTMKKSKSVEGFMFADKGVGGWFSAFSYGATYFSAVIFVGYAGSFGSTAGLSAIWIGIGNALIGTLLAWLVLAKRTKYMTTNLGARTMPEFFEKRYESKYIKIVASLVIFIFLLPYSASVYTGLGNVLQPVLGIESQYCILILAGVTALYLFLGGYFATSITDFIQGIIMLVGITTALFVLLGKIDYGTGLEEVVSKDGFGFVNQINLGEGATFKDLLNNPQFTVIIIVALTSLGIWGLPQSVHKFYAVRDNKSIKRGMVISTVFALIVGGGAYFIGGICTASALGVDTANIAKDMIIPTLLVNNLKPALLGLIIVLLFSASMSTLAALSLSSASTVTIDFVKGYVKKDASDKNVMVLMRVLCLVFVAISAVLAILKIGAIVTMMSLSWGTLAGCFIGPYIYGLYDKRANKAGAYGSIILSIVMTLSLVIGLGYYLGANTFGQAINLGVSKSPFIGVCCIIASLIFTPVFNAIFYKKFKPSDAVLDKIFVKGKRNRVLEPLSVAQSQIAQPAEQQGEQTTEHTAVDNEVETEDKEVESNDQTANGEDVKTIDSQD